LPLSLFPEGVYAYFAKNIKTFKRSMGSKQENIPQAVATNNVSKRTWAASDRSMLQYFRTQLFIAGL
jgi:hypothetical protein